MALSWVTFCMLYPMCFYLLHFSLLTGIGSGVAFSFNNQLVLCCQNRSEMLHQRQRVGSFKILWRAGLQRISPFYLEVPEDCFRTWNAFTLIALRRSASLHFLIVCYNCFIFCLWWEVHTQLCFILLVKMGADLPTDVTQGFAVSSCICIGLILSLKPTSVRVFYFIRLTNGRNQFLIISDVNVASSMVRKTWLQIYLFLREVHSKCTLS